MDKRNQRKRLSLKTASLLVARIIIYVGFVAAYYFFVLLLLRNWLKQMFDAHKVIYAITALPLIIGQAVVLNFVITCLRKMGGIKAK